MLKGLMKHRPRNLVAVYVEPRQVEVLRAHRQWRAWRIDSTEQHPVQESESIYDFLQRLNLRPRGKTGSALVLFLPRLYYSFHREHYPSTLEGQLDEALNFDWQENVFLEHERSIHFFGPAVSVNHHLTVPIFSMQTEVYEKFRQALGAGSFQTFAVIPSALTFGAFFSTLPSADDESRPAIVGRAIDPVHLEIHRFYNGLLLDSVLIGRNWDNLKLFRENLRCLSNGSQDEGARIHLLCVDGECVDRKVYCGQWREEGLPIELHRTDEPLISHWVRYLFELDRVETFDTELSLKPWEMPRVAWPFLFALLVFAVFSFLQVRGLHRLQEESARLKKQISQLETQWQPIEALQNRISKFQEDQKTLSEFNMQGYPTLEILTYLTQITPDDTWLNYFSIRKGQLMLRGESKSAIKFLSELSKVEGLTDVKFAAPVHRNPSSDMDRFNVQLQVDMEKMKKTFDSMPVEKLDEPVEVSAPADAPSPNPVAPKLKMKPSDEEPPPDDEESVEEEEVEEVEEEEEEAG